MQMEFVFDTPLGPDDENLCYLGLFMNTSQKRFEYCGTPIKLTRSQFELMQLFMSKPHTHHNEESIRKELSLNCGKYTLPSLIRGLRRKLTAAGAPGRRIIITKYGIGHRIWNRNDLLEAD